MGRRRMSREMLIQSKKSLITHHDPKTPISEQYRTIRTSIQFAGIKNDVRLFTVTSPLPKEGKSTTASNLAIVFAQQKHKVLLIDADLRKPSCHVNFKLHNYKGLTNLLLNMEKLEGVVQKTYIPYLDILTSGPIPPNPSELLGLKRMDWILDEVRRYYDYVIIDSPPVLPVTDALILSQKSDGVVLVTNSGKTSRDNAKKAKELLLQTGGNILGVVLNMKGKKIKKDDYYYYGEKE